MARPGDILHKWPPRVDIDRLREGSKGGRVAFTDRSRLARRLTSRQVDAVAEHLLSFTRSLGAPVADEGAVAILEAGRYPKPRLQSRSRTTEKREESRHTHSLDGGVELETSGAVWSSASTWLTGGERGVEQGHKR